tara:strand:+ start:97 stop:528 length:432 start_codon:yes stop_codon:yes gene_type:complete
MNNNNKSILQKSIDALNIAITKSTEELNKIIINIQKINESKKKDAHTVTQNGQTIAVTWILQSATIIKENCNEIQQSNIDSNIVNLENNVNNVKVAYNNAKATMTNLNELSALINALVDTVKLQVETLICYKKFVNRLCTLTP